MRVDPRDVHVDGQDVNVTLDAPTPADAPRVNAIAPGSRLGPYSILAPLARGGMGEVFVARDTRLGRRVAVKVLAAPPTADAALYLRRFEIEARAVAALAHPNVLSVFDVGVEDEIPYIVFELLEGETLRDRIARGAVPTREAVTLAVQVARGLAAAHDKGIIHRDLKPENIFVTDGGEAKVLDFGLAKLGDPAFGESAPSLPPGASVGGGFVGTVLYMSPEQARAQSVDLRSDLFTLGVILHEMLAGRHPFKADTIADTVSNILAHEPPPLRETLSELPPGLDAIVARCLRKKPAERFQSAHDLGFALETTSTIALPRPPAPATPRPRRRALLYLAGALALAAASATAASWWRGRAAGSATSTLPTYKVVDWRTHSAENARFALRDQAIVYNGRGDEGELRLTERQGRDSRVLEKGAALLAVSSSDTLAVLVGRRRADWRDGWQGTLALQSLAGGGPRPIVEGVYAADFVPGGDELAVSRDAGGGKRRLELPVGHAIYETAQFLPELRVSPDGKYVAFHLQALAYDTRGAVGVVDREGRARLLVDDLPGITGLAWSPDGREVWYSTDGSTEVGILAVSLDGHKRVVGSTPSSFMLRDVGRGGEVLGHLSLTRDDMGAGRRGAAPREETDLSWRQVSVPVSLSADGRSVLFVDFTSDRDYSLYLRPTDGGAAVRLGAGEAGALSPDGRFVLAHPPDPPRQLRLIPTGPGESTQVTNDALDHSQPAWLPDGRGYVFVGAAPDGAQRLYRASLDGGAPTPLTEVGRWGAPAVAPDGARLAVADGAGEFWIIPVAGGQSRRLATAGGLTPIRWSADGAAVFAFRVGEPIARVVRVDVARETVEPWLDVVPQDAGPVWRMFLSEDGERYVYGATQPRAMLLVVDGLR